ncbi:HdeD family acid-resistance protein [Staphylococcus equorum]|uniref:HdeD family acid-resistance protein n=1 Tax=Staphylococcus equorum TaxID=246432 RepID=UPI0037D9C14B
MQERSRIKWSSLVIGVIFLIIGVFILSFPEENLFAITWLIGLLFIINGFLEIFVRRVMKKTDKNASTIVLVLGVINIILGLLILFNIVTSTTFIVYLFAIWFIINALFNMFTVTPLEKSNKGFHIVSIILNIITVVFGIILLFNPLMAAILVAIFMSSVFFIIGITYIIKALS